MPKLTPDKEKKILQVYDQVLEYKAAAKKLRVSEATVRKLVKKYRPPTVPTTATIGGPSPIPPGTIAITPGTTSAGTGSTGQITKAATTTTTSTIVGSDSYNSSHGSKRAMKGSICTVVSSSGTSGNNIPLQYAKLEERKLLKTLYTAFRAGKKPDEIVALYGFDPEEVDYYYKLWNESISCNFVAFQQKCLSFFAAKIFPTLQKYQSIYDQKKHLTNDETFCFVKELINLNVHSRLNHIIADTAIMLPDGYYRAMCPNCGRWSGIVQAPGAVALCASCYRKMS